MPAPHRPHRLSTLSGVFLLAAIVAATVTTPIAQISGPTGLVATRSVNMVSGDSWPNGDPFLQRQNEPSVAVSTRNTQHLLAGANDYRTVDLPGISTGPETGDAWLGVFKSFDGGERWQSTLLPGYPQDTSAAGMASPLKAYQAGADPVVRAGTNGLLYFSGLAFNRGANAPSGVFMARFIDNNNKENGDPISYLGVTLVDKSTGADFIDKPWMAVDVPRQGAKSCKITQTDLPPAVKPLKHPEKFHKAKKPKKDPPKLKDPKPYTQSIPAGMIYLAYSRITTVGTDVTSRIMFTSSDDCGETWTKPLQISDPLDKVNQGATIAIDPVTGAVSVAWRQFGLTTTSTDSIMVARSPMKGKFDTPAKVHKFLAHRPNDKLKKMIVEHQMGDADDVAEIQPFDQGSAEDRFRTNAYPTIAIDDESRAYLAWTERGFGVARSSATEGDARVVIATSKFGGAWTAPRAVDVGTNASDMPGHQLMPSVAFAAGKLVVVYYDLREDVSQVFGPFVSEQGLAVTVHKRHTIDIRSAYAAKGDVPVFGPSIRVSQYVMGSRPGSTQIEQLQYNAPNLPLFKLGTVPFMGDYIDIAPSPAFVQESGSWRFNTKSQAAPVFHVVWTDNRDVRPPKDGNWQHYTPVKAPGIPGTFDPNQPAPECVPGQTGMRNQNIYSARLTFGLVTGSPGNAKPIDPTLPRGFVVFAQNTTTAVKSYRMTIASQPVGGKASFTQTPLAGHPDPLISLDVSIPAKSMISRTVFITSTDPHAQVAVDVKEISAPNMPIVNGGLESRVILNPDISNPDISNPDISNPDISNPDISNAEVYNPDISNPDISNPDISNPDISNPDISNPDISNVVVANPDISNPDISNPDISNPDISNPDISNPDISNPDISNGALTDVTWTIVNTGNTTTSFNVNLFLANAAAKLAGVKTQLIVHKTYTTPVADDCTLKSQTQTVLVANVPNPTFQAPGSSTTFDPSNPAVQNTTVWLEPGGTSKITLRLVDPNPQDNIRIDPVRDVTPVVLADPPVNTADIGVPNPEPPPVAAPPVPDDVFLNFNLAAEPTNTILTRTMSPVVARAMLNGAPAPGVQVTVAIANNPAGGHLSGTTTVLTDANGNAIFTDLSIEKAGVGYRLSASASAFGALPDLSSPFDVILAPVTAAAVGGTFTYDGQPHNGSCSVTGFDSVVLDGAISYSSGSAPVNAGSYTVTCSYSGNGYYGPASHSAAITITPAASSTNVTCSDTTYTGAPRETCSSSVTGAGGLNTSVPVSYSNNTNAGTATGSASYPGDANHNGSSGSANFTIFAAPSTTTVTCSDTTYTGAPRETCTSAVTGAGGLNTTAPVTYTNNTNAGTATGSSSYAGDANHAASDGSANFTIAPAASSTAVTCSDTTYTGAPRETCTSAVTGAGGLSTTVPVSYSNNTNAGTATGSASYPGDANHNGSAGSANFTISRAASTTTVTCSDTTYTGAPRETCTSAVTGAGGLNTTAPVTYTNNTNAGTATGSSSYAGDGNHTASDGSANFTIAPAPSTTTVTCSDTTYTGTPRETCTSAVTGAGGLSTSVPVSYSNNTNAGTATGSASYPGDANHNGSAGSANFTISPASSSTTVACSDTTYTGTAQQPCTSTVTGAGGLNTSAPVIYANNVNAGTGSATSTYAGDANHAGSNGSSTFTINPATPTADAVGGNFIYNGAQHPGSCTVTGVSGQVLSGAISWSSGTPPVNPGLYTVTCAFPAGGNYTAASDTDTIAITDPYLVTKTVDDGSAGTLRFAINTANANADANTISFAIPAPGPFTITPTSPLPAITQPVLIDGLTQAGSATYAPVVTISGASAGANTPGFQVQAGSVTIRGLGIQSFTGAGVLVLAGNATTIEDNVIRSNNGGVEVRAVGGTTIRRNVLSANSFSGVIVSGSTNTTIANNRIGTTPDGTAAMGNLDNGVTLFGGASGTLIDDNVISGNNSDGIDSQMNGVPVSGLRIINNTIGLALNGDTPVPNHTGGIALVSTEGAIVGEPGAKNTISGNALFNPTTCAAPVGGPGIRVLGVSTVMPVIKSNYIGLSKDGLNARPNGFEGIILGTKARVGGPGAGEANWIAGNGCAPTLSGAGVLIQPNAGGSIVQGNTIGLSKGGVAFGNGYSAISAFAVGGGGTQIGGFNAGELNVLTGNNRGIAIYQSGSNPMPSGIVIQGNQIGTNAGGTMPGNSAVGIDILNATNITIGGGAPGSGNLIKGNGAAGIQVAGPNSSSVTILANSIDGNGGLGIDLVNGPQGPTANDPGDTDTGPNGFQNFPVLSNPSNAGATTTVDFTLDSDDANAEHTVQVFVSPNCDASGHGEGAKLVGSFLRMTSGGSASGTLILNEPIAPGNFLTATATDDSGNTSEFSACVFVPATVTITSVSPANGKANEGFLVLRGANLPTNFALVKTGATTQTGFVLPSASGPNGVWVRLPFGLPLGPATIQLKDAFGTVVSNAMPITVTANPGTPVITGAFNGSMQPVSTPLAGGDTIRVAADGLDTTGAVVRFVQGANTWDVPETQSVSGGFGVAAEVTVPNGVATGVAAVSVRQGTSAFSAPVNINVVGPPVWSASGPGSVTVNDDGTADGTPDFNYAMHIAPTGYATQTWEFSTTSPAAKTINLQWSWSGFHAFFQVTARLDVFVRHLGVDTIVATPVNAGPANCCSSPSAGFSYSGSTNVVVQAGDTYGFRLSGRNADSDDRLQGSFAVIVTASEPAPLLAGETGLGVLGERADLVEQVIGRAIVEEDRRRFTAAR